ncbi:RrF2 family transcriptional regulator [Fodinicola feengrottensis]|uniref:RrF2 family transcriptional regulator n=1 Tax=Fodinicola feengrottensis TaxID=435914 RepID=UPI0028BDBD25|nr:Rrf2 family transcriptional regulator [Fodinicola feengrottensis]
MRLSGGVESALHCCVVLTSTAEPVPATRLAELHGVSATYLAKQLQALSRADLVHSVQGKSGGYVLTRSPAKITVLDVVEAVDGSEPTYVCTEIRQRGPLAAPPEACTAPCAIARTMSPPTAPGGPRLPRCRSRTCAGWSATTTTWT